MQMSVDLAGRCRMSDRRDVGDAVPNVDIDDDDVELVRREEELRTVVNEREVGRLRLRKTIEEQPFEDLITRGVEHADIERIPPSEPDSGEVEHLPDGSVSIPVFEEQLVVEKRLVVRERVVIRKRVVHESERIETQLRREVVEVDSDPAVDERVHVIEPEGRVGPDDVGS